MDALLDQIPNRLGYIDIQYEHDAFGASNGQKYCAGCYTIYIALWTTDDYRAG